MMGLRMGRRALIPVVVMMFAWLFPLIATASDNLVMLSIDFCPACEAAKRYFKENGIDYSEYNLNESKRARQAYERLNGRGTPVLFVTGKSMNGFHPQRFRQFWMEATGERLPEPQR